MGIEVQRLGTSVPSTAPTTPPTYRHTAISGEITDETTSTSDGFSDGTIAGIVIGLMFSFGLIWMAMNGLQTRPSNLKGRFLRTPPSEIAMKPGAPLNPGKVHPSVVFQKENAFAICLCVCVCVCVCVCSFVCISAYGAW